MPDSAKPLKGLGAGVMELVLRRRGNAFRVVFAMQLPPRHARECKHPRLCWHKESRGWPAFADHDGEATPGVGN